eukprot:7359503-Prymnesium_polylepis.1
MSAIRGTWVGGSLACAHDTSYHMPQPQRARAKEVYWGGTVVQLLMLKRRAQTRAELDGRRSTGRTCTTRGVSSGWRRP